MENHDDGDNEGSDEPEMETALKKQDMLHFEMILSERRTSPRYHVGIEGLANRALSREWPAHATQSATAPVLPLFAIVQEELRSRGKSSSRALRAYEAILCYWQEKAAEWLGSSVSSTERLAVVIDSIVRQAETLGGLPARSDLMSSLHRVVMDVPEYTRAASVGLPPAPLQDQPLVQNYASDQMVSARTEGVDVAEPGSSHARVTADEEESGARQQPVLDKYPDAYSLFRVHAIRAKKKYPGLRWAEDDVKSAAKAGISDEWVALPSVTVGTCNQLHGTLIAGDSSVKKFATVAHLFHEGHACSLDGDGPARDEGYHSAHPVSSNTVTEQVDTPTAAGQVDVSPTSLRAHVY